jgi:hypothetical protein
MSLGPLIHAVISSWDEGQTRNLLLVVGSGTVGRAFFLVRLPSREAAQEAAQGASTGFCFEREIKPCKGERESIPNVTLVIRDLVLLHKRHKFVLKRSLPVVFVLRGNVLGDRRNA